MVTIARRAVLLGSSLLPVLAQVRPARAEDDITQEQLPAILPELTRLARQAVKNGDVPGLAIAVVHRDKAVYLEGFGLREAGKPQQVDADTVFQLASCSKPISSTVVAALVGEKLVSWDARISDIDPGFHLHDPYPSAEVTVTDLFAHRSGLPGAAGNELEEIGYGWKEIRRRLRLVRPSSSFRAGYSYSNSGLTEGAVAAAHAAGLGWEDAAEQKLFKPLGMNSTSARYRDFTMRADRASLHVRANDRWVPSRRDADAESPAGGVSSSARDMAQWMRLQLAGGMLGDRRIIEAAALARTHEPVIPRGNNPITGLPEFYGLGWGVHYGPRGVVWAHSGAFSQGAQTIVTLLPADQLGIVVLTNAFPSGVADGLAEIFTDMAGGKQPDVRRIAVWTGAYTSMFGHAAELSQALYGKPPASPTPALPASAYVGAYANAYLGTARVIQSGGAMLLKLGPEGGFELPLTHYNRDLFTVVFSSELPDLRSAVTFRVGPEGKASAVTIEALDETGLGTLTRAGA